MITAFFIKPMNFLGDRTLALILASQGDIYCFDEKMSCYRYVTAHGTSFGAQNKDKNDFKDMYKYYSILADYCNKQLQSSEALKDNRTESFYNGHTCWYRKEKRHKANGNFKFIQRNKI